MSFFIFFCEFIFVWGDYIVVPLSVLEGFCPMNNSPSPMDHSAPESYRHCVFRHFESMMATSQASLMIISHIIPLLYITHRKISGIITSRIAVGITQVVPMEGMLCDLVFTS
ncbi:MAG: hypothetical protein ACW99R_19100 [Candidatus Hodarchaeales archaeon]